MPQVSMQNLSRKAVTLVLGGARSGKSRYVQTLAAAVSSVAFVATARPPDSDEGMHRKIERHRAERPKERRTIEEPRGLGMVWAEEGGNCRSAQIDLLMMCAANFAEGGHGD